MKICFAIHDFRAGGAERVMSALANELAMSDNLEISIICFEGNNSEYFYTLSERIKFHTISFKHFFDSEDLLKMINPDIIVSFCNPMNYFISVLSRKADMLHIACERNNPYFSPTSEIDRQNRNKAFFNATGCVFQTSEAESYFKGRLSGKTAIIKNPVILDFQPENTIVRERKIVTVGRYVEQKNYPALLQAFASFYKKYPHYLLETYGKNSGMYNDIVKLAETIGINDCVSFNKETTEVHRKIYNASVFVLTSSFEGLSNALAEAAALGIPCVATDTAGTRDIIKKYECGILVPANNPDAIAKAIEKIICNPSLANFFSKNGKRILLDKSIKKIAEQWLSFFSYVTQTYKKGDNYALR